MSAPKPSDAAFVTDLTPSEEKLLGGNRVLTQKIAALRASAQRSWESLEHYVSTRTEDEPCGFCGLWGEHDNDACDLVAVVTSLEEDFFCGEHWRGSNEGGDAMTESDLIGKTATIVGIDTSPKRNDFQDFCAHICLDIIGGPRVFVEVLRDGGLRIAEEPLRVPQETAEHREIARLRGQVDELREMVNAGRSAREGFEGLPEGTLPRV